MDEGSGLEGLILGGGAENQESLEAFEERMKVAKAKLQGVKKQEGKAKVFDHRLAGIITTLNPQQVALVSFFISKGISSLTILAFLSLENESAYGICYTTIHKHIEEMADFDPAQIHNGEVVERISLWITFIFAADHISNERKLCDYKNDAPFRASIYDYLWQRLDKYVASKVGEGYYKAILEQRLQHYHALLFQVEDPAFADRG